MPPGHGAHRPDWRRLRLLANGQCDLLTRQQCLASGLTLAFVRHRVASGRWTRLHPGVYLTAPGRRDWDVTAAAALLAVQPRSGVGQVALFGRSAAYAWQLTRVAPDHLHIAVPETRRLPSPPRGVIVHRVSRWLRVTDPLEFPWRTTIAATVLDCAELGDRVSALRWVTDAVREGRTTTTALRAELLDRAGHRHGRWLRESLLDVTAGVSSVLEHRYLHHVERAHGLPTGVLQSASRSGRAHHDSEYTDFGVVVETDGRVGHDGWAARVRDSLRDLEAAADGKTTLRLHHPDVEGDGACQTALALARLLRDRGWTGHPHRCGRPKCTVGAADPLFGAGVSP